MITSKPLKPQALLAKVNSGSHGAVDLFIGVVRDHHKGRGVRAVTYEAHAPLAAKVLTRIRAEAESRFAAKVAATHRLGRLRVGQASVVVAASSAHRAEAFAACRYVIEQIKARLPVWKKEHYADGTSAWLDGRALPL
jgi:molybdopterin synthase catalytic subunit